MRFWSSQNCCFINTQLSFQGSPTQCDLLINLLVCNKFESKILLHLCTSPKRTLPQQSVFIYHISVSELDYKSLEKFRFWFTICCVRQDFCLSLSTLGVRERLFINVYFLQIHDRVLFALKSKVLTTIKNIKLIKTDICPTQMHLLYKVIRASSPEII